MLIDIAIALSLASLIYKFEKIDKAQLQILVLLRELELRLADLESLP